MVQGGHVEVMIRHVTLRAHRISSASMPSSHGDVQMTMVCGVSWVVALVTRSWSRRSFARARSSSRPTSSLVNTVQRASHRDRGGGRSWLPLAWLAPMQPCSAARLPCRCLGRNAMSLPLLINGLLHPRNSLRTRGLIGSRLLDDWNFGDKLINQPQLHFLSGALFHLWVQHDPNPPPMPTASPPTRARRPPELSRYREGA